MKLPQLSLRELFLLLLVAGLSIAALMYASKPVSLLLDTGLLLLLVLAASDVIAHYPAKRPFSLGFIGGVVVERVITFQHYGLYDYSPIVFGLDLLLANLFNAESLHERQAVSGSADAQYTLSVAESIVSLLLGLVCGKLSSRLIPRSQAIP